MDDAKALLETKEAADTELLKKAKADKKTELENISFNIEDESKYTKESVAAAKAKFDELKREALAKVDKVTSKEELKDISINVEDAKTLLKLYSEDNTANTNNGNVPSDGSTTATDDNSSRDTIIEYSFLEKPEAAVDVANGGKVIFRINVDYKHFLNNGEVYVDGKKLTIDKDYTAREGSTIIDLTPSFLKSLAPGKHSFRATFDGGKGEAVTEFEIAKSSNTAIARSPKTGDDTMMIMYTLLIIILFSIIYLKKGEENYEA
ncbi:hypothetical protein HMPREF1635_01300 [Clostridiales bacterium S5-A14a]|nr:hypothetical protein HMPREF1635_01300 [Clostridiales bacterium S5-A14a]